MCTQGLQVDDEGQADPSSSPPAAVSPSRSQPTSSAVPVPIMPQKMQLPANPVAASYTTPRPSVAAGGLLTKLRSRTAASMLEGSSQQKVLNVVPSAQDHRSKGKWGTNDGTPQLGEPAPVQVACAALKTSADYSLDKLPLRRGEVAGPNSTPASTFPSHMQSSVHIKPPTSGPPKSQQPAPLCQAMLEQSTRDRAQRFAQEDSLAAAAIQNTNISSITAMGDWKSFADTGVKNDDKSGIAPSQVQLRTGTIIPTVTLAVSLVYNNTDDRNLVIVHLNSAGILDNTQGTSPRILPQVRLNTADEEMIFGLTVRLQYAESALEVASALQELAACTVADIPPAAILHRTTLLENILNVMTSSSATEITQHLALQFLHSLVIQCKQALQQVNDPEQCPLYDGTSLSLPFLLLFVLTLELQHMLHAQHVQLLMVPVLLEICTSRRSSSFAAIHNQLRPTNCPDGGMKAAPRWWMWTHAFILWAYV